MNLIAAFALASLVAAPVPKTDPGKLALENMQGEWKVVESIKEGRPDDAERLAKTKVVIKGNTFTAATDDRIEEFTFTLDATTDPPSIDIKPAKEKITFPGIYKLEKDKLTICYSLEGSKRPKEFKSEEKSRDGMLVLQRVKKK